MASFEEKLILLVQEQPCLYNKKSKEYKNSHRKEEIWLAIAAKLEKPG